MSDWTTKKLGELITLQRGHDLPSQERAIGDIPIMGSSGITGYHDEAKCKGPGVVIGRSGNSMGEVSFCPVDYWPLNTCLYVTDFKGNDELYIYYLLKTIDFDQFNSGSAQKSLNRNAVYPYEIYTTINNVEQKEIGRTLFSIEEKIHLNTQTNQTLESIAQAIFKSWFVDFEPVKAKIAALAEGGTREQAELAAMRAISGKSEAELARLQQQNPEHYQQLAETAALFPSAMIESELGEIPEGWEVQNYSNLCKKIESGGTPKRNEDSYWNGEVSWLSSGEVRDKVVINTKEKITIEGLKNSSAKLWPKNTTVIAMYGATAGEACLLAEEMSANQACCGLIPKTEFTSFLYLSAIRSSQLLAEKASGSAQQNLNKGIIENHNLIAPPSDLAQQFEHTVQFMILELIENYRENFSLAKLRDTLLPKLLSGEIDLSDIQSEVA